MADLHPSDIERSIRDHDGDLVALLQKLIRAKSPNPPGDESEVAAVLEAELRGWTDVELVEPAARRVSLVSRLGANAGPHVVCNAHIDTVPVDAPDAWSFPPFGGALVEGAICGRGAVDHKSPVAALVIAAKALERMNFLDEGQLTLVFDADEEAGGKFGADAIYSDARLWPNPVDFGLYAAPSSWSAEASAYFDMGLENIFTSSLGRVRYQVILNQDPSYLTPTQSLKPGEAAVELGMRLGGLRASELQWWWRGLWRVPRINETVMTIDRMLLPGENAIESAEAGLATLQQLVDDAGVSASATVLEVIQPALCPKNHRFVQVLAEEASAVRGRCPWIGTFGALSGMSQLQQGISAPCAMFGFGGLELAHATDERVEITDLVDSAVVYARALARILKPAAPFSYEPSAAIA